MVLQLYNTLTRKKEIFKPLKEKEVKFFVCGPTTYNYIHLGNAKTYTQFDMIANYLRYKGYKVKYIQNITDIDDKIIKRAQESKEDPLRFADQFYQAYLHDTKNLGITSVSKYIKATMRIKEIISQVKRLLSKGYAYKISNGIYFDLSKDKEYGKLSGRTVLEAEDATSRIDNSEEKRNKGDFCLWKFSKPEEISWKSSLGNGRPGWHIEDTAITEKEFGPQYDIHGGAVDLIFPHHEAEIAQMESISGKKPFVKYWLHTGFLDMEKEKMSKSIGNIITLREALKKWDKSTIRFLFASSHYKSRLNFSEELMDQAKNSLQRINDFIRSLNKKDNKLLLNKLKKEFENAMDDDINTPKAFAAIFDFINKSNKENNGGKVTLKLFKEIDKIFKIFTFKEKIPKEIVLLAEKREKARANKDWSNADKLRQEIQSKGYLIEDKNGSYTLKKA